MRPATPRFFVVGDEVMLSAVVNNNTGEEQDVTSFVEATGLEFTDGDAEQTQTVPAGGRARFAWAVTVQDMENVDVTFFASADDGFYTDASKPAVGLGDERLLPVYRFDVPETVGTAGTLSPDEPSVTETIQLPQTMEVINGTLDVNVDTSLAGTTLDGLDYLRNYDQQSISATVSKFLPNVVTYNAFQQFGVADEALAETLDEQVSIGLQTLNRQQKMDGGWGWYPQDESNPLVTAYALLGLVEAQNAGYPVADDVIGRARQYLLDNPILAGVPAQGGFDWEYDREAFVLYVLARADAAPAAGWRTCSITGPGLMHSPRRSWRWRSIMCCRATSASTR